MSVTAVRYGAAQRSGNLEGHSVAMSPLSEASLANPILHSPYLAPDRHFVLGPDGPTGEIATGRRPSTSWVPIPPQRKGKREAEAVDAALVDQQTFELAGTGERIEANTLINDIRQRVELWRANNYNGVTPTSRTLLEYWAAGPEVRDAPVLWCQREAAETAIYLAEVAGRKGEPDFRRRVDDHNAAHNDGLPRVALKMATGSGKTVVMAMLIAWQTLNKLASPNDVRFAKRFLVITPGITIRDRLRVLDPADAENYYDLRDLVPADLRGRLAEARVEIVNYHAFLPRTAKELKGVSATTRKLLTGGADPKSDQFVETGAEIVARVLGPLLGRGGGGARGARGRGGVGAAVRSWCSAMRRTTVMRTSSSPTTPKAASTGPIVRPASATRMPAYGSVVLLRSRHTSA